jgi:hypothetical protein
VSGTERIRRDRRRREKATGHDHPDEGEDDSAAAGRRASGHDRAGFLESGVNVLWTVETS